MSNPSHERNSSGGNRGRRNRGGRNRRDRDRDRNHDRQGNQGQRHGQSNRSQEFRPPRQEARKAPPPTWWQKLLGFFGLWKPPVAPSKAPQSQRPTQAQGPKPDQPKREPREGRQTQGRPPREGSEAPRSNTRVARTPGGDSTPASSPGAVDSSRLYVGNLSYEATESDLEDLFKGFGSVRSVEIVYNRRTHVSKGYAFIEMHHLDDAKRAVEVLHDQPFMGRKLTVNSAKSRGPIDDSDDDAPEQTASAPSTSRTTPAPAAAPAAATTEPEPAATEVAEPLPEAAEPLPEAAAAEVAEESAADPAAPATDAAEPESSTETRA